MNNLTKLSIVVRQNPLLGLYRHHIIESVLIVKRQGFRELVRRRGWRFLLAVAGYYLVRDTFIYVVLPLGVAHGLL